MKYLKNMTITVVLFIIILVLGCEKHGNNPHQDEEFANNRESDQGNFNITQDVKKYVIFRNSATIIRDRRW